MRLPIFLCFAASALRLEWRVMRSLALALVFVGACTDSVEGTLLLMADSHQLVVGASTSVGAYLYDGTGDPKPVSAEWSVEPAGIVMLTPTFNLQKVTGVAAGQVVVTATAFDQTAKTGFTVFAPQ